VVSQQIMIQDLNHLEVSIHSGGFLLTRKSECSSDRNCSQTSIVCGSEDLRRGSFHCHFSMTCCIMNFRKLLKLLNMYDFLQAGKSNVSIM